MSRLECWIFYPAISSTIDDNKSTTLLGYTSFRHTFTRATTEQAVSHLTSWRCCFRCILCFLHEIYDHDDASWWAGSERRTLLFRVSPAKSHCTLERRTMQLHCLLNMYACRWVNVLYMVWKVLSHDWWPRSELISLQQRVSKSWLWNCS